MEDAGSELRIDSTNASEIERLHPWFDCAARNLPPVVQHGMRIALEEAVMNAASHGVVPGGQGEISVQLRIAPDCATIFVKDSGLPFDPSVSLQRVQPSSLHEAEPGGLGLVLLHHFCPDINYARVGERNILTLRFPLPGA